MSEIDAAVQGELADFICSALTTCFAAMERVEQEAQERKCTVAQIFSAALTDGITRRFVVGARGGPL